MVFAVKAGLLLRALPFSLALQLPGWDASSHRLGFPWVLQKPSLWAGQGWAPDRPPVPPVEPLTQPRLYRRRSEASNEQICLTKITY